jgi:hypothetical protein
MDRAALPMLQCTISVASCIVFSLQLKVDAVKTKRKLQDLPPVRVRREPPTVDEAIAAAQGLTEEIDQQVEIAAELIGMPAEEVRPLVEAASVRENQTRLTRERLGQERLMVQGPSARPTRVVVVERRSRFASRT